MKKTIFKGAATAIVTPLTKDGIDYEQFGRIIEAQIAGGTEFAPEIAGVAGIDVDDIGRTQRQGVFQLDPVVQVDPGNGFCIHGVAPVDKG